MKKVRCFFRSILLKIGTQVHILSIYSYIKLKKMPRLVRGCQPPCAAAARFALARTYLLFTGGVRLESVFPCFFIYYIIVRVVIAATRVAKMTISQGCHPRRVFLLYIYNVRCHRYLHAKFQKIDLKTNPTFFIQSCSALFLLRILYILSVNGLDWPKSLF